MLLFGFQQAAVRVAKYILTLCNSGSSKHKIVGNIASWNFITRAAHFWHTLKPSFKNTHIFTKHPKLNQHFLEASFCKIGCHSLPGNALVGTELVSAIRPPVRSSKDLSRTTSKGSFSMQQQQEQQRHLSLVCFPCNENLVTRSKTTII